MIERQVGIGINGTYLLGMCQSAAGTLLPRDFKLLQRLEKCVLHLTASRLGTTKQERNMSGCLGQNVYDERIVVITNGVQNYGTRSLQHGNTIIHIAPLFKRHAWKSKNHARKIKNHSALQNFLIEKIVHKSGASLF